MTINDAQKQSEFVKELKKWVDKILPTCNAPSSCDDFTLKDLFIGFDPNETLQSLVINTMRTMPHASDKEVLARCKESLVAIASADGIVRTTKSVIHPDENLLWRNIYFSSRDLIDQYHDHLFWKKVFFPSQEQNAQFHNLKNIFFPSLKYSIQFHDHLEDYFTALFCEVGLTDSKPLLVIVNTFSSINANVRECLQNVVRVQVDNLSTFKTERQLQNSIKNFWLKSDDQMLILQCDTFAQNARFIKSSMFIIEQCRNEFLQLRNKDMQSKHACIILHIHREQGFKFHNFIYGWRQVTIETLVPHKIHLPTLLDGSLESIMQSAYPFEDILKQELKWCLLCMKYPSTINSINRIK